LELYCIEAHRFFQGLEKWAPPIMSRRNNVKMEENAFFKIADERPLLKLIFQSINLYENLTTQCLT